MIWANAFQTIPSCISTTCQRFTLGSRSAATILRRPPRLFRPPPPTSWGYPGAGTFTTALYPVYVRAEAYLAGHQGSEAATEFQKILDHRGIAVNAPIGALAHLGLARANALKGDTAKARSAYQDFLTLWKDADPDIPILQQAKAEYAKLK
jgi:hypothetical protein